jgi:MFS family permease
MAKQEPIFYGWIVLAACFAISFCWGAYYSYGVFLKPLAADLGQGRGIISSVFSFFMVVSGISGIFIGRMIDKYGTKIPLFISGSITAVGFFLCSQIQAVWQLYLCYGIISIGAGLIFSLPLATVQRWFVKGRGLALGITTAGAGAGNLILAPLTAHLISCYGWRSCYVIIGTAVFIVFAVSGLVIVPRPELIGLKPYGKEAGGVFQKIEAAEEINNWNIRELIHTRAFVLINAIFFFSIMPTYLVTIHICSFATDIGFSKTTAALILGLIFGFSIPGRIFGGLLAEKIGWVKGFFFCCLVCAIMVAWLTIIKGAGLYLFVILYGLFFGSRTPMIPGLAGYLFGTKLLAEILGIINISGFVGGAVGASLAGFIFDKTGSYYIAFLLGALSWALAGILSFFVKPLQKSQ